jgi:hypothetical protein
MNDEEKELFKFIRTMTSGRMRSLNGEMRQWATDNTPSSLGIPHTPAATKLDRKLGELKLHLDLWLNRYETLFLVSARRSLVYLRDLRVPGVSFPEHLDKPVEEVLHEVQ